MDRATAVRLHRKLRALAADRAAQPGEKAVATEKADKLAAKFKIGAGEAEPAKARPKARTSYTTSSTGVTVVGDWSFDATTGRGSPNVTVQSYRDRSNWKIEVDLTQSGRPRLPPL